jgi:hypothetical protein
MRIETTEHGRQIVIDVTEQGVRVQVFPPPPPTELVSRGVPMTFAYGGGGSGGLVTMGAVGGGGGGAYCPTCTGLHDPKEHAEGGLSPAELRRRDARPGGDAR